MTRPMNVHTARTSRQKRRIRIFPGVKTKRDIVAELAAERRLERFAAHITRQPASRPVVKDLAQTAYLYLLEFPEDKLRDLYECGQLDYFVARIMVNQWFGSRSSFRVAFRKFSALTVDINEVVRAENE